MVNGVDIIAIIGLAYFGYRYENDKNFRLWVKTTIKPLKFWRKNEK